MKQVIFSVIIISCNTNLIIIICLYSIYLIKIVFIYSVMAFASDVEMSNSVEVASQIESSAVENALATNCISKTDLNKVIMNYLFTG